MLVIGSDGDLLAEGLELREARVLVCAGCRWLK